MRYNDLEKVVKGLMRDIVKIERRITDLERRLGNSDADKLELRFSRWEAETLRRTIKAKTDRYFEVHYGR